MDCIQILHQKRDEDVSLDSRELTERLQELLKREYIFDSCDENDFNS